MMRLLALFALSLAAASACSRAQAKTPMPPPALMTPAPPDRVIVPATMPEAVEPPAVQVPAPQVPVRPAQPASRPAPAPAPTTPATSPPAAAAAEPTPPPVLQTTSNPGEVEQKARTLLQAAQRDLDLINPTQLSANARAQYDTARAFVRQAENALRVRNVVLARELADKAANVASQLRR